VRAGLAEAIGATLAEPVVARHPLPPFDTSMMDGWAVAGDGPWRLVGEVLAGATWRQLGPGEAVVIATGAQVPVGADAVLRSEHGREVAGLVHPDAALSPGRDIRRAGEECGAGELLLAAGTLVSPPVAGLSASAGHDELSVHCPPSAAVFVLGDELLDAGLPRDGKIRDSLSVQVPAWAIRAGARSAVSQRVADTQAATVAALRSTDADLILTSGGTARGPVDHLHAALAELGAELVVDSVAVRPGHPMLLARLHSNRFVVGLPGNPMAAAAAFCTLALPVLAAWAGRPLLPLAGGRLTTAVSAPATEHRLIPAVVRAGSATPLPHQGSAMLRGLAAATDFALSPPGGAAAGAEVELLPLPWV
jgi:molybdopterin molybdotransferase